jgi:hypothetical protein
VRLVAVGKAFQLSMAADNEFWTETSEVVRLFPTFVRRCQLRPNIHRPINATILNQLDAMLRGQPRLDRGVAYQSGHQLHKLEELRGLVSCIHSAVGRVLAFLRIISDSKTARPRAVPLPREALRIAKKHLPWAIKVARYS